MDSFQIEDLIVYLSLCSSGNERYTLKVKNLVTQYIDEIDTIHSVGSIEPWFTCCWSADSRHLFYIALDEQGHSKRVYRHTIGHSPSKTKTFICQSYDITFKLMYSLMIFRK
jgi:protease II